jgi:hypothetical protein
MIMETIERFSLIPGFLQTDLPAELPIVIVSISSPTIGDTTVVCLFYSPFKKSSRILLKIAD